MQIKVYQVERGSDFWHLVSGIGEEQIEFPDGEVFWILKDGKTVTEIRPTGNDEVTI